MTFSFTDTYTTSNTNSTKTPMHNLLYLIKTVTLLQIRAPVLKVIQTLKDLDLKFFLEKVILQIV